MSNAEDIIEPPPPVLSVSPASLNGDNGNNCSNENSTGTASATHCVTAIDNTATSVTGSHNPGSSRGQKATEAGEPQTPPAYRVTFRGRATLGKNPEQSILNVLRLTCVDSFKSPDFQGRVQEIKKAFYARDFDAIFLTPENLPVYSAMYTPRRALCYYQMFTSEPELVKVLRQRKHIYCLGAGSGSELLGISAAFCHVAAPAPDHKVPRATKEAKPLVIHTQDYADWTPVLTRLEDSIRRKWGVTEGEHIRCEYSQNNLMEIRQELRDELGRADLVTVMFVFNELFTAKSKAMEFVKAMVMHLRRGALLLLVDSAGSFSSVKVGERNYMSHMFFDALKSHFKPLISDDARWYRHPAQLDYPLPVENMRYFIRLYQKL
ncbi:hypothetical protein EV182_000221 [Spiromyces aspiralis]|uniref:Uncharacterized protein n=1 Tax=Spiromyces aspiralis TaxID=68401 RepID=A0ACC1HLD2_9FUNG|nr:hypothetical protein EV182_000221 [Spiromyces aspiralis]